jgi:hypothetical protein
MIELNKVWLVLPFDSASFLMCIASQKFRAYLLDSDKAVDVLAHLLCYGLEIKDKPRASSFEHDTSRRVHIHRTT